MASYTMLLFFILALQGVKSGRILDHLGWADWNKTLFPTTSEETPARVTTDQPCGHSLFIKSDIEDIVDYMYDQLYLNETITTAYHKYAKEVHDNKMTKLVQFEDWFNGQPEHLKDVISEIAENRKGIERKVRKIAKLLQEREQIEVKIKKQEQQYESHVKKYNIYKTICEENCGPTHKISKRSAENDQYCGTAEEIKNVSTLEMEIYILKLIPELLHIINGLNKKYDEKIESMEYKIKESALKYFGPVMYDTLFLQEEYHNYKKLVSKGSEYAIYDIKKTLTMIDADLIQLELAVEDYKKKCLACIDNSNSKIYLMSSILDVNNIDNNPSHISSLLDIVIKAKTDEIHAQAVNDIATFYQDVDAKIEEIEQKNVPTNFEPIKNEIINELAEEKKSFHNLKEIAPIQEIKAFIELQEPLNGLQTKINVLLKKLR